ncbi:uncharacterized protein LOC113664535 isoform X3 [Pocillopora damicornis]|uniref:uncharacterized protein LOC113664535 isoform X3 n=1 Tax=Pocillopora damicornis TaxID=46731 RepID=UPI000F54E4B8|nr:uncharacterized protein LOC113664535 isoform X3 [Pocillopora damicornis]
MADTKESFASSTKACSSSDLMREKLEKWRRMKGRSSFFSAKTVHNRSRSAVSFDINKDANSLQKREMKESRILQKQPESATERYKRISDHACKLTGEQRRRKALNIVQRKALLDNARTLKTATSKETPEKLKTYKDKTLSMRQHNPDKAAVKSKSCGKRLSRMSACMKENLYNYHRLEHTKEVVTPASTKLPFKPRVKSTSTLQSHHQPSIVQSNGAQKSKLIQCELTPQSILPSNPEVKSYKNKALDIRERLDLWLAEKGKTPKYRTPAVPQHSKSVQRRNLTEKKRLSFNGREETVCVMDKIGCAISLDEGENVEEKLKECLQQLELNEYNADDVRSKLDLYKSACPHICHMANYWLCRAKIAQHQKDFNRVVCLLEQAFVFKAQPDSVLKDAVCTFVNFIKENEPKDADIHFVDKICLSLPDESPPSETKIDMNDISSEELNSSIIKFCLMEVTPHRKKFKTTFGKRILTPVRRSVRLERASVQYSSVVQEHGLTVRTLKELPEDIQQDLLFKPNFAVQAELNEVWNKLQLDSDW